MEKPVPLSDRRKKEGEVLEYWESIKLPEKLAEIDFGKKPFFLLDGPPYANDKPHVGHVKTIVAKDIFVKFKRMQGYSVFHVPGFDMHGLPIEVKVEKELGITSKSDIERVGVEKFMEKCREFACENMERWMDLYKKLGVWKGWYEPYKTCDVSYLNSAWFTIKNYFEKGLLVEGEKPGYWCPRCQTILTGYEVTDSYKEVEDPSIIIKFPIKGREREFLLVWTTTPWTLAANVAIAAHPKEIYVKAKVADEIYILAEKRLSLLDELGLRYTILERFEGEKLSDIKYKPVIDCKLQKELEENEETHRVIMSIPLLKRKVSAKVLAKKEMAEEENIFEHLVTMDVGTGLVHIAPGHGAEDFELGKHYNLPSPSPLDDECRYTEEVELWKGKFVKDADREIIKYLDEKGLLLYASKIRHSYPLCWRCKTPLIFRKTKQWFLKVTDIKDKIIEEAEKVCWLPEFAKKRYINWALDLEDWALSRQRYWGITLPIWRCEKCNAIEVFGSKEELEKRANCRLEDLHKDKVDPITFECKICSGKMKREPYTLDVWFDSGIAPWASLGYPFKNKELFDYLFPCALVIEAQDQIRGWFNSLMICSIALFGKAPYKKVGMIGWVLDEKGEKMSKSLGNVVWGEDAWESLGADLLRLYYCKDVAPWEVQKFSFKEAEALSKVLNILENLGKFYLEYCKENLGFDEKLNLKEEDLWLLSKTNSLIEKVTEALEKFELHRAGEKLVDFLVETLSRIYVKLARERLEIFASAEDKKTVSWVMDYALRRLLLLLAPIVPFTAEMVYRECFGDKPSIHLEEWPSLEKDRIDSELEKEMELCLNAVSAFLSRRQEKNLRLRWPVKKGVIYAPKEVLSKLKKHEEIIKRLANLKELYFDDKIEFEIKPNFERIGKKFGRDTKRIAEIVSRLDAKEVYGKEKIEVEGFVLEREDLKFKAKGKGKEFLAGLVEIEDEETKEIKEERAVRELIRAIQTMRKELGLKIKDRIRVKIEGGDWIKRWEEVIKKEVNASEIIFGRVEGGKIVGYKDLEIRFDNC